MVLVSHLYFYKVVCSLNEEFFTMTEILFIKSDYLYNSKIFTYRN